MTAIIQPVRLQLSRRKGFDLQALSRARNGLPAVNVARPSKWGNPFDFRSAEYGWIAISYGCRADRLGRQQASVFAFKGWVAPGHGRKTIAMEEQPRLAGDKGDVPLGPKITAGEAPALAEIVAVLKGKNLACWCKPGEPCHADVLLEIANQ